VRRRARREWLVLEGRGCHRLGCSDDRAPPPPRPAPALDSRHLPPPALLMLLLADMDVVNQVRSSTADRAGCFLASQPGSLWPPPLNSES
jgi:hypothetical protein